MLSDAEVSAPESITTLHDISAAFHGYPLALAQVAGFIRTGGCSLHQFQTKFRDKKNSSAIASIPVSDYHATLLTVWNLSFSSLSPQSRQILEILVYLDPDSIPYTILQNGCIAKSRRVSDVGLDLSYMADSIDFWKALQGLREQSLIRINRGLETISIHRFVQDQALQHLCGEPANKRRAFEETLFLLTNQQPEFPNVTNHWSPELFKVSELCLPHIKKMATRFFESPEAFRGVENRLGKLIFECASYQFERFHHQAATETFALARKVLNMDPSPNELTMSDCYRMEGRMFNESGQPLLAEESNKQARDFALKAIKKEYISRNDRRMPRILTGLGNSLSQLFHFESALTAQLDAIKLCGDVGPAQSDAITIIQLNLGFLMFRRGDLLIAEKILGATLEANPRTPPAMYALGNTLLAQGHVEDAIATHLEGLKIYIQMFGDQHALVARCVEYTKLYRGQLPMR